MSLPSKNFSSMFEKYSNRKTGTYRVLSLYPNPAGRKGGKGVYFIFVCTVEALARWRCELIRPGIEPTTYRFYSRLYLVVGRIKDSDVMKEINITAYLVEDIFYISIWRHKVIDLVLIWSIYWSRCSPWIYIVRFIMVGILIIVSIQWRVPFFHYTEELYTMLAVNSNVYANWFPIWPLNGWCITAIYQTAIWRSSISFSQVRRTTCTRDEFALTIFIVYVLCLDPLVECIRYCNPIFAISTIRIVTSRTNVFSPKDELRQQSTLRKYMLRYQ